MLLNLEWRKLKGLGELIRALNVCLDTKCMGTTRLLLSVKNLQELASSPFPYIALVIPRPLPGKTFRGEYFVLVDLLKSIPGSSFQAGFA